MENLTGKEALERLGAEKLARGELIRNDNKVEPYINCIKQDLDKLEKLEKENLYLKEQNEGLQDIVKIDKQIDIRLLKILKENIKLKKVIKILKRQNEGQTISQEEYELLKEVCEL